MRLSKVSTLLTLALLPGVPACSGNASDDGATDNASNDDGTGGTKPGDDATGGAKPGDDCNIPACVVRLADLTRSCKPSGSCVVQATESSINECYSDGRRLTISVGESEMSIQFLNSDASVCLIEDAILDEQGNASIVFKDASGATLGTATSTPEGLSSVTCDGRTYQAAELSCPSMPADGDSSGDTECTPGVCP